MTFDPELPKRTSDKVIAVFPDIAGHSPTAMGRELYELKSGTRDGKNAIAMKPVVAKLTDEDVVNLAAYVASLQP